MTAVRETRLPAPTSLRDTLHRLSAAQKGAQGAPAYSRFVNRRLGRLLAALAFHSGLTPNAVTGLSAGCTATGMALLVLLAPGWQMALGVSGCLVLGYALDSADGQLARLRGGGSAAGEWLDHMVDAVKASGLHLAVLVGLYHFDIPGNRLILLIPLCYSLVDVVLFFGTVLNDALRAQHGVPTRAQSSAIRPSVVRSLLVLPTDYGLLCVVFLLYGAPTLFLPTYAVLLVTMTAFLVLAAVKWFAEIDRLPR